MKADQLQGYLARSAKDGRLDPFWLLTGSDAFLAVEAGDAIRAEARRQGYTDRQVLDMNASADWSRLTMAAADIGMFDDRKIVDVRLSTGNPGKNGAPAIVKYLDNPIDGVVTLITMPAPDWTVTKEAWWGALQRKATVVDCSPVERAQLPAWLKARLARHELVMSPETLDYFADMMEGNLFAAAQEIEKLSLLHPKGEITSEQLRQAVSSNARFDFDTLFESMRLGQADRIVRIIDGLEAQAEALPFLLAMLTAEIRSLIKLRTGYDNGQSRVTGVFATPSLQKAARRLTVKKLCGALSVCADIDRLVKGLPVPKRDSDPWISPPEAGSTEGGLRASAGPAKIKEMPSFGLKWKDMPGKCMPPRPLRAAFSGPFSGTAHHARNHHHSQRLHQPHRPSGPRSLALHGSRLHGRQECGA